MKLIIKNILQVDYLLYNKIDSYFYATLIFWKSWAIKRKKLNDKRFILIWKAKLLMKINLICFNNFKNKKHKIYGIITKSLF